MRMFALVLLTSVYGASAQRFFGSASFPEGCTGARKPASESFCITAAVRLVQDGGADITMFIFGDDDPTKSTNYRMEYTPLSSRPNFRATGGGSAKAVQVGFPGILGASVTLSTETSGDGGATFYPHTRKETANTGMTIDAEVCALGTCFDLASSSTNITADAGPDLAAGMEANFKASTGNSNCGVSIDYDLKMKIRDRNIFTWLMTGEEGTRCTAVGLSTVERACATVTAVILTGSLSLSKGSSVTTANDAGMSSSTSREGTGGGGKLSVSTFSCPEDEDLDEKFQPFKPVAPARPLRPPVALLSSTTDHSIDDEEKEGGGGGVGGQLSCKKTTDSNATTGPLTPNHLFDPQDEDDAFAQSGFKLVQDSKGVRVAATGALAKPDTKSSKHHSSTNSSEDRSGSRQASGGKTGVSAWTKFSSVTAGLFRNKGSSSSSTSKQNP